MKAKVNDKEIFEITVGKDAIQIDNQEVLFDIEELGERNLHVLHHNKSYEVELVAHNSEEKTAQVKVNGNIYQVSLTDQFDDLLKKMGIDAASARKVKELKAPMPGLVLSLPVTEGQEVIKGQGLVVLEAMKMENSIKAPADATIQKILVNQGDKVEKNQVLIQFH
ncbi:acetyl-CoA carboxylase biotin carboxyl carrier protein subunit [Pedobacter faecalis]|uniref:acetyl-CoA carboxylase biotin carboxyl carrier protein subunit n=1 Tax=Pedobacter faecalis TaxID=3041495 RepID=UPI00254B5CC5|nr:biotin/lipoyl-containing protein [Pedobacter sp. ELA7]